VSDVIAAVLMYHRISLEGADRELLCVPPDEFRAQMQHLSDAHYNVLALEELAEGMRRGTLPPRAVALTFDDGYLDSLTAAAVVLSEFRLPASFFVVTAMHEEPHEFWWDALERALGDASDVPERLEITLAGENLVLPTAKEDERRTARERVKRGFYSLTQKDRDEIVAAIVEWSGVGPRQETDSRGMNASEIQALARLPGMSIGSHTVNHLLLPAQSRDIKYRELTDSKRSLEELLGRDVSTLCYPYGGFDVETALLVREAGYACAVSTGNLPVTASSDPFVIPRVAVRAGDDLPRRLQEYLGRN
jgi:peptidoglycan/xylan/chitin deacetylase (PgdA/CDA1 family)